MGIETDAQVVVNSDDMVRVLAMGLIIWLLMALLAWLVGRRKKKADKRAYQEFRRLAAEWKEDTRFTSSVSEMILHENYQRIIGLGPVAIPWLLRELREGRINHWFWALRALTGTDPVPEEHAGKVQEMSALWISWGEANGYI